METIRLAAARSANPKCQLVRGGGRAFPRISQPPPPPHEHLVASSFRACSAFLIQMKHYVSRDEERKTDEERRRRSTTSNGRRSLRPRELVRKLLRRRKTSRGFSIERSVGKEVKKKCVRVNDDDGSGVVNGNCWLRH